MAFPTSILSLADAIGSQFLSVFFGGSVAHSTGINQMKADLVAAEEKIGTGASTPTAGKLLGATGTGTSGWRTAVDADIDAAAAIAVSKLAAGANKTILTSNGTANSMATSATVSGSLTAEAGLNIGAATGAGTGEVKASGKFTAGTKIYPGVLNGPSTGAQSSVSLQSPYFNNQSGSGLGGNTSTTISSFPVGRFTIMNLSNGEVGSFDSNSVSTVTDRGSSSIFQIGGSVPSDSTSKIWVSLSSGTLTIRNVYPSGQIIAVIGFGAN